MKVEGANRLTVVRLSWCIQLCSAGFQRLWRLPLLGEKLQLPEVTFFPMLLAALSSPHTRISKLRLGLLDVVVLLWPVVNALPGLFMGYSRSSVIEILASCYVVVLYYAIRLLFDSHMLDRFIAVATLTALIAASIGAIGWLATVILGFESRLAIVRPYPYFGKAVQAVAFTAAPNMLASILMFGIILFSAKRLVRIDSPRFRDVAVLGVLGITFLMTLSKTLICLVAGLAVLRYLYRARSSDEHDYRRSRVLVVVAVIGCAVIYVVASHVIVADIYREDLATLSEESYISPEPLTTFSLGDTRYGVFATNYLHNKIACLRGFTQSRGAGIGAGNHPSFVVQLQQLGKHPEQFPNWTPHSTYFGALSELGVLGLIEILLLWIAVGRVLVLLHRRSEGFDPLLCGITALMIAIAIEAISTDIMRFRHYWWLLGIVGSLAANREGPAT